MEVELKGKKWFYYCGKKMCHHCYVLCRKGKMKSRNYALFSIGCKRWDCEICGKAKAFRYAKAAQAHFSHSNVRFLTLTLDNVDDVTAAEKIMAQAWNRLRLRLERKINQGNRNKSIKKFLLTYLRALEYGEKNGRPHYHILLNHYFNQKWLSRVAYECGFGKIVDIRHAPNAKVIKYITKYVTKSAGNCGKPLERGNTRFRRIVVSRDIRLAMAKKTGYQGIGLINRTFVETASDLQGLQARAHKISGAERSYLKGKNIFIDYTQPLPIHGRKDIGADEYRQQQHDEYMERMYLGVKKKNGFVDFVNGSRFKIKFNEREKQLLEALHEPKKDVSHETQIDKFIPDISCPYISELEQWEEWFQRKFNMMKKI
jgi:hypothetical protein